MLAQFFYGKLESWLVLVDGWNAAVDVMATVAASARGMTAPSNVMDPTGTARSAISSVSEPDLQNCRPDYLSNKSRVLSLAELLSVKDFTFYDGSCSPVER
jgi:hypothetical protein